MSIKTEIVVFIFNSIYTVAPFFFLTSILVFWVGVAWLVVSLFRQKSVARPLGTIISGMALGFFSLSFSLSALSQ